MGMEIKVRIWEQVVTTPIDYVRGIGKDKGVMNDIQFQR